MGGSFAVPRSYDSSSSWNLDTNVTAFVKRWMSSSEGQGLDLCAITAARSLSEDGSQVDARGEGLIWELHNEIKHQMKADTNRQLRATRVADKSNQSRPLHHLTSNKITSINNRSYEWLDFVCFQSTREGVRWGAAQFSQWLKQGQIALITSRTLLWQGVKGQCWEQIEAGGSRWLRQWRDWEQHWLHYVDQQARVQNYHPLGLNLLCFVIDKSPARSTCLQTSCVANLPRAWWNQTLQSMWYVRESVENSCWQDEQFINIYKYITNQVC